MHGKLLHAKSAIDDDIADDEAGAARIEAAKASKLQQQEIAHRLHASACRAAPAPGSSGQSGLTCWPRSQRGLRALRTSKAQPYRRQCSAPAAARYCAVAEGVSSAAETAHQGCFARPEHWQKSPGSASDLWSSVTRQAGRRAEAQAPAERGHGAHRGTRQSVNSTP